MFIRYSLSSRVHATYIEPEPILLGVNIVLDSPLKVAVPDPGIVAVVVDSVTLPATV